MPSPLISRLAGLALALAASLAFADASAAERGPDAPWWGESYTPRAPDYPSVARRSVYVPMPDGVRLAVDIYLPEGLPEGAKLPAIIEQTRYFRSTQNPTGEGPACIGTRRGEVFGRRGFAYVVVDVRGTGASFGSRDTEFGAQEVKDGAKIVDWIIAQPWSNGLVGATGVSYVGTTAELLLSNNHPAVRAIAPQFAGYDFYTEINVPGGVRNEHFIARWSALNEALDAGANPQARGAPVCAVDGDADGALRAAAIAEHKANISVGVAQKNLVFRDDQSPSGITIGDRSAYSRRAEIDRSQVPFLYIGAWTDVGYARGAVNRFINTTNPNMKMVIGAWNHGGNYFYAPGVETPARPAFAIDDLLLRFFDSELKGIKTGYAEDARVRYFTSGENAWKASDVWPPRGLVAQRWCFAPDAKLDVACRGGRGADQYVVRTDVASGNMTRWDTALRGAVAYPDRAQEDAKLLTYTSAPLEADLEVTGQPRLRLEMRTDQPDGIVVVYLEEVTPEGKVWHVTEGQMRLTLSTLGRAPYRTIHPEPSYLRADAVESVAGRWREVDITLLPTSHVFKAGSSLRVAIAGADGARFLGATPGAVYSVRHGGSNRSWLELPVGERP